MNTIVRMLCCSTRPTRVLFRPGLLNQRALYGRLPLFLLLLLASWGARAQVQLQKESFETDGEGTRYVSNYTILPNTVPAGAPSRNQYFFRASEANMCNGTTTPCTGNLADHRGTHTAGGTLDGTYYWAGEGVRGATPIAPAAPDRQPGTVTLNSINTTGYRNLQVKVGLQDGRYTATSLNWETNDTLKVQVRFNGTSPWVTVGQFTSDASVLVQTGPDVYAGQLRQDVNLDGKATTADPLVTATMQDFTFELPSTATTLQTRFVASQAGLSEEFSFDNIRVLGTPTANAAPVLANSESTIKNYPTANAAVQITNTITLADADSPTQTSATVRITAGWDPANDVLAFTGTAATGNITGTYSPSTGVLTLTSAGSTATLAQWQAALRLVTFQTNTALPSGSQERAILFSTTDPSGTQSNAAFRTVGYSPAVAPTVSTAAPGSVAATSAVLGGNVTADGGDNVTERGVVYSTSNATPDIGGSGVTQVTSGSGTGAFSATLSGLTPATTYYVRAYAINSAGTSYGSVVSFTTPAALNVSGVITNVSCFGGSNGAINLTPSGGTAPYSFNWGGGITTEDRTGLAAGTYSVTITDASSATITRSFTVTQPATVVGGTTVVTNVSCFGGSNGAINLTPNGGTGPYTYNWGGGITTEDRTGLTAGTYTVIITDARGCTSTVSASVTQPTTAVGGSTVVTNVSCFGGSNGAINLTPSGGTGPYTFFWTPSGPTTEDRTGLSPGTYSVTITDANGCTGSVSATVTQPATAVGGTTVVTNVSCFGGSNGAINLTPNGGTGPYTYNWGGGITTEDRTGLTAGTYTVIITDARGCTSTVSAIVTQPTTAISLASGSQTNVTTTGGSDGTASVTPTGGTPGYTYDWAPGTPPGDATASVSGLSAGTYTVTVTDANGCTASRSFTITQPAAVTPAPVVVVPANGSLLNTDAPTYSGTAPSGSTVTVYVDGSSIGTTTAPGGNWSLAQPAALAQGSHTVYTTAQVTGNAASANSNTNTFTLDSVRPTVAISSGTAPDNGTTGTSPIPFTVTFSESVTGFVAGDLTVSNGTVSGFAGSGTTYSFNVTPSANGAVVVNVPAVVAQDAAANFNTAAGPYTITYSQPVTAAPVVVSPANGSLLNTDAPTYSGTAPSGSTVTVFVDGSSIGTTTAPGGTWSLAQPAALAQGNHTVYATAQVTGNAVSANSTTKTFTLDSVRPTVAISSATAPNGGTSSSTPFAYTVTFSESVTGFVTGDLTVSNGTVSGFAGSGTTYSFNVTPSANGVVSVNVPAVVAQDAAANFNTAAGPYTITYSATPTIAGFAADPASVCVGSPLTFTATVGNLTGSDAYTLTNGSSVRTGTLTSSAFRETLTSSGTGNQSFTLTVSSSGQSVMATTSVTVNALPVAGLTNDGPLSCSKTSVTLTASGGGTYQFSPGATQINGGNTASVNTAGPYSVTVTGTGGCTAVANTTVMGDQTVPTVSISANPSLTITQGETTTLTANVSGGTPPFGYAWSTGASSNSIVASTDGPYSVSVTGPNGCSATASVRVSVIQPSGPFAITAVTTLSCETISAGQRRVTFNPRYASQDSSPISFSVVNELAATTSPGPYSLSLYTDNSVITLSATQSGANTLFAYNWLSACSATTGNTPPTVANPVSPQSATVNIGYTLSLANVFTDAETPNGLTLSVSGLPAGLNFVAPSTISGTPSMSGVSTVTVTATDPGSMSASTSFTLTVNPAAGTPPPPTGTFSITSVQTIRCEVLSVGERRLTFNPQYAGLNGAPVSFSVVNELAPTTAPGPYTLNLYTDNSVVTLQAVQSGISSSFAYNWLSACSSSTANTAPTVANPVPPQSATVDVGYTLSLANVFTDAETPNQLTLSVSGLPAGLSFSPPSTISGTPSMSGVSTVTVTATDPGSMSASTSFTLTVNPAGGTPPPPSGTFSLTGVSTVSCEVVSAGQRRVSFTPRYAGLDGSPVSFRVVNETVATTAPGPYTLNLYTDNPVISLEAVQSGVVSPFSYGWLAACNPGARQAALVEVPLRVIVLGNPVVGDLVSVEVRGAEGQSLRLQLRDERGHLVSEQSVGKAGEVERQTLRLGQLPAGVLLLRVSTSTQSQTLKLIKME